MEHEQPRVDNRSPVVAPVWFVPEVLPDGWVADPIGPWNGIDSVVLYRPDRHHVLRERRRLHPDANDNLTSTGWEPISEAPEGVLWVRDRLAAARDLLTEPSPIRTPVIEATGPEVPGL